MSSTFIVLLSLATTIFSVLFFVIGKGTGVPDPSPRFDPNPSPPEPPQPAPEAPVPAKPIPMPEPVETKRERLYRVAKGCIGRDMSPDDVAPDALACVESVNGVFHEAFGEYIGSGQARYSTSALLAEMLHDSRFEVVDQASSLPGDISIAATGTSAAGASHGHVGIKGHETYMSNDSSTGLWKANYTLAAWVQVFHTQLKFPLHYFRVKG